jgi:hypothetical protein
LAKLESKKRLAEQLKAKRKWLIYYINI